MIGSTLVQSVIRRFNNLLDTASAANGAAMVGFQYATAYAGNTVGGWLKGLATAPGSTFIGWAQAGAGALTRKVSEKLLDLYSGTDYATGDGATDDTVALNALIVNVPAGVTIDGLGKTYVVSSLTLKSNVTLRNFSFFKKAGTVDLQSVITVDGTSVAKANIRLENIVINGNRANQTNIADGSAENGGRHGFRFLGSCQNIRVYNCSATFCAGDGIEFYSNSAVANLFQNIVVEDCVFTNNRRHGGSLDSAFGVRFSRCKFNANGLDLNTVDALTVGTRGSRTGATLAGTLYGEGFDVEGYGNYSSCRDVTFEECEGLGNAWKGLSFFANGETYAAGDFVAWQRLRIIGGHYDEGIDVSRDGYSLAMTPPAGTVAAEIHFRECSLLGVSLNTPPLFRNALNIRVEGDVRLPIGTAILNLTNCNGVVIDLMGDRDNAQINATGSTYVRATRARPTAIAAPVLAFASGAAGVLSNIVYTEVDYDGRGYVTWQVTFDYAATATASAIFSLTLPAGVTLVDMEADSTTSAGAGNPASVNLQLATPRIFVPQTNAITTNNLAIVRGRLAGT